MSARLSVFPTGLLAVLIGALIASQLGGCGFHLRGAVEIPPELNPLYIKARSSSPVRDAIEDQLIGSPVQLTDKPAEARLILRILSEGRSHRVAAVTAQGRVLAYELHYRVSFDAVGAGGETKVKRQTIDLVRTFDNPDVEVLGKQLEQDLIYEDFAFDAADRILMVLRTVLL